MPIFKQVGKTLQYILNDYSEKAGKESGFIQRVRKVTGSLFIRTVLSSDADSNNDGITDGVAASFGTTDTDNDGVPDALETLLGRDVTPTTDTDGDGMPDVAEVLIGRDPIPMIIPAQVHQ